MISRNHHEAGFSLVELAIGLVVIGLLVGGVLKGVELIESARLKSVLSQVNDFRVAVSTFMDRYDALPGDYHEAAEHINPALRNGNNSGSIDGQGLDRNSQAFQFWGHLAEANLLPKPGTIPGAGYARPGKGVPQAKIGGGFTIVHTPFPDMPGHWFVLGEANGAQNNKGGLTPLQAMSLDKKADNGDPTSGRLRVKNGTDASPTDCIRANGTYNTDVTRKVCVLYFQL